MKRTIRRRVPEHLLPFLWDDERRLLPVWAQTRLAFARSEQKKAEERERRTAAASAVLAEREWFTLPGPDFESGEVSRHLWFLNREHPHMACALGPGDLLLIGRKDRHASLLTT